MNQQETRGVDSTAVNKRKTDQKLADQREQPPNRFEDLSVVLRKGWWIDLEVVLRTFEEELGELSNNSGSRYRAGCLAKLRLALIMGQVRSAPEAYAGAETLAYDSREETKRFFPSFAGEGKTADDLKQMNSDEFKYICEKLIPELAVKSRVDRSQLQISLARLATPPRSILLAQGWDGRQFEPKFLSATHDSAFCQEFPADMARRSWYDFQDYEHQNDR